MEYLEKNKIPPDSLLKKKTLFFENCDDKDIWAFYCQNKNLYDYRTSEVKKLLLEMSENRCAICSRSIYDANHLENKEIPNVFTIEHVIPKYVDPHLIFEWDNMIPCCATCNNVRGRKKYEEALYINPCKCKNCGDFFGFAYDGSIYCLDPHYHDQVEYMIQLYGLNGQSNKNSIKLERKRYYRLLIDEDYQELVKLNNEFGLSDNIILFKDMYQFNKRYC